MWGNKVKDEIHMEDNIDINAADNNVSDHEYIFNFYFLHSLLMCMRNQFMWIFMTQQIRLTLLTKGTH